MNLAAVVGAALALVDGEPILELVWTPARSLGSRASCHVRTAYGWTFLYSVPRSYTTARTRRSSPFPDGEGEVNWFTVRGNDW